MQVGLLNVDGYYNSLLSFIDKAVDEGFVSPAARHIIVSAQTAQELMSKLEVYNFFIIISLPLLSHTLSISVRMAHVQLYLRGGPRGLRVEIAKGHRLSSGPSTYVDFYT